MMVSLDKFSCTMEIIVCDFDELTFGLVERYDLTSIIFMNITAINSTTTEYISLNGGYVRSWGTNNYPK